MKKILKILLVFVISMNANCQVTQLVPLNTVDDINGAYQIDIDNELPFWVGTWKGEVNNKEYTFQFTIFNQQLFTYPSGDYYYRDMLMAKFKVKDLNTNEVLYNDLNITNYNEFKIRYQAHVSSDHFFAFSDSEINCNNSVDFVLAKITNNPNQIKYKDFKYTDNVYLNCPYANQEDIPMFLPKEELVLTRQ